MNLPTETFRDALKTIRRNLRARFFAGETAQTLVEEHTNRIDGLLREVWRQFPLAEIPYAALVAVGGYGRGELHPGSDIDLLLLFGERIDAHVQEQISNFLTFLWDIGLEVGHSTRTLRECEIEAASDITVITNLMETRLIEGQVALFERLGERIGPGNIWPDREFFQAKSAEQQARYGKFHNIANNLEPNVKEGPGGMRDIQMISWVAKRHFGTGALWDLVGHGFLTETEYQTLTIGRHFLWDVRFALHLLAGRREDRLLFDYQRALAEEFGYKDKDHNLAVEHFMKRYYCTIREHARLNEMLLALFQEAILYAHSPGSAVPIGRRFRAYNGFLEATNDKIFKRYPFALLEIFLILQQHPELTGVRAATIRLIRDHLYLIDHEFRADIRARSLFLEILKQPDGITHALRRMHHYGVLGAYLPAFEEIIGQMQYDLFHVYTVDEHTLFVVHNLVSFAALEQHGKFASCAEIFAQIPKRELLYIAGLFHDIAKGRGGDHAELGAKEAFQFCQQHGISQYDAKLVAWLVENHLLLSMTIQRKDIHDPEVVNQFATTVGNRLHLDYLYLLTVADIRGTNPKLWNDWKHTLLRDLYEATLLALHRGPENPIDQAERIAQNKKEAYRGLRQEGLLREKSRRARIRVLWKSAGLDYFLRYRPDEIIWHTRAITDGRNRSLPVVLVREGRAGMDVFIYAQDQQHLFLASTTILDRLHLTIHDARIISADNGMTLNSYVVLEASGNTPTGKDAEHRQRHIRDVLTRELQSPKNALSPVSRLPKRQLKHFTTNTIVSFYTDSTNQRTIMEVSTGDRPGLLSQIAATLAHCEVRLHKAKIATFGEWAEDIFFITDKNNQPLSQAALEYLRENAVAAV
ncbi:MAG: UTP--GlnB (protein PII) uridylyltransferase, GlnD [Candidatus Kentron sp. G]|nr:MAG: UTP--GlnB (protein PII) uridylyltransferase, GlnD [Candidatus Kentron sp. G]VFN00900.1 MAG: UTP--GlnB (protein PII) uridylyltransferase, GlnD [Candidatus Kentron sp. G]VFN02333.1 MAG: UTP--GlnB (protein PII) uridylyltransferase, GlnD [Candidatus Kentron sp. G]